MSVHNPMTAEEWEGYCLGVREANARMRRWQIRLRVRAHHDPDLLLEDRLLVRADITTGPDDNECRPGDWPDRYPIAGPRGTLP